MHRAESRISAAYFFTQVRTEYPRCPRVYTHVNTHGTQVEHHRLGHDRRDFYERERSDVLLYVCYYTGVVW